MTREGRSTPSQSPPTEGRCSELPPEGGPGVGLGAKLGPRDPRRGVHASASTLVLGACTPMPGLPGAAQPRRSNGAPQHASLKVLTKLRPGASPVYTDSGSMLASASMLGADLTMTVTVYTT